ncbi:MAG TPA: aconitase X catalytic domain-containing protein [Actinomycetota bacterium]|nr:aconitase X catalytic domain-containing protein [Actinomycetota bacterium]
MPVETSAHDRALLSGSNGDAAVLAMRIVLETAEVMGADRLIDIESGHVDGCLYHGVAGLEFAERLVAGDARVAVPTTLNVGYLDLLHPQRYHGNGATAANARRQMDAYVAMGCRPTWTCAPYQLPDRPGFGKHVAWAESNAIVFCNSVLGARTNRYGDFIDVCAAITGRAPYAGLHREEERLATVVLRLDGIPSRLLESDVLYPALGHAAGHVAGAAVPAIVGLPRDAAEDRLKSLGAAAASSGSVAMFHAVGITPEAPTLEAATGGADVPEETVTLERLRLARDELTTANGDELGAVCVGTPHASLAELERLAALLAGRRTRVPVWVNTGRNVLADAERLGVADSLTSAGVNVVTDTCTYIAPLVGRGPVMTDSAKWAWYAPANIGVRVTFGSLEECVRSAIEGHVVRDAELWGDA